MPVSDVIDKSLTLRLGGVDRPFRYSFGSYALLADRYGSVEEAFRILGKIFAEDGKDRLTSDSIAAVVDAAHAGLQSTDKAITRNEVADLIDITNFSDVLIVVIKAQKSSLPTPKEGAEESDPPQA